MKTRERAEPRVSSRSASATAARKAIADAQLALDADQTAADADQSAADVDQTMSDLDQTASARDQTVAERDQRAADRDQASADRERAGGSLGPADERAYATSRRERKADSVVRLGNRLARAGVARDRDAIATRRDARANARDVAGRARDARAADVAQGATEPEASLLRQLEELAAEAAADRARAAADRTRAALDRATAARERARLEAALNLAHLDELTGTYRREMGRTALANEIERARRSDGRFVLAFIDVDELKAVNDRDGHAAGDHVLQAVTGAIRARLRSFDPIIRYGGDEFVCGLSGTDLTEARRRFREIGKTIQADVDVGISVGFASLDEDETVDTLTARADAAMLRVKATHHASH